MKRKLAASERIGMHAELVRFPASISAAQAEECLREIGLRLKFLNDVGLNYLSLDRSAETLSGGEAQRIRLASQIGSGLTGVMYVLDEPSIGLHQRDNDRLIATLKHLRDIGNSVIVVEHDEDMMRAADHVIDMGPGAGVHGGRVMAQGTYDEVRANPQSLTGQYLSGTRSIAVPKRRTPWLPVVAAPAPVTQAGQAAPPTQAALDPQLARNAAVVLGNTGSRTHLPVLQETSLSHASDVVREAARWALEEIEAREALGADSAREAPQSGSDSD